MQNRLSDGAKETNETGTSRTLRDLRWVLKVQVIGGSIKIHQIRIQTAVELADVAPW